MHPAPASSSYRVTRALIVFLGVAGALWRGWSSRFLQDDAYISFVYARNLARGHGLVYWPGEYVEGYTNFLWTVILGFGGALGFRFGDVAQALGLLSFALSVVLVVMLCESTTPARSRQHALAALPLCVAWLLPLNPSAAFYATGGLATSFFGMLCLATVVAFAMAPRLTGFLALITCLARPEGPLLWCMVLAARAVQVRSLRVVAREHALPGLVFMGYLGWKLWYYGDLLPNTFYVKSGHDPYPSRGLTYLRSFFQGYGYALSFVAVPLGVAWNHLRDRASLPLLLATSFHGAFLLYVVWVGGGFMEFKPVIHAYPMGVAALGVALCMMRPPVGGGLALLLALMAAPSQPVIDRAIHVIGVPALGFQVQGPFSWKDVGLSLGRLLPPDTVIAVTAAGAVPFYSDLKNVDPRGLTERHIARLPVEERGVVGHEKRASNAYLRGRGVNLLFDLQLAREKPVPKQLVWVRVAPDRWISARYLTRTPELTAFMKAHPEDFLLPPKL